jgi:hypothetical protein
MGINEKNHGFIVIYDECGGSFLCKGSMGIFLVGYAILFEAMWHDLAVCSVYMAGGRESRKQ